MIAGAPASVLADAAARGRLVRFGARFPGRVAVLLAGAGPGAVIEGAHGFRLEAALLEAGVSDPGEVLPTWSGPALIVVGRGRASLRRSDGPAQGLARGAPVQLAAGDVAVAPRGWRASLGGAEGALAFAIGGAVADVPEPASGTAPAAGPDHSPDTLRAGQRVWGGAPFGEGALAPVSGGGLGGKPGALAGPAGVTVEWLRLEPGRMAGPFVPGSALVLMVQQGGALLRLNRGAEEVRVPLGPWDLLSVPAHIPWRAACAGDQALVALLVSGAA